MSYKNIPKEFSESMEVMSGTTTAAVGVTSAVALLANKVAGKGSGAVLLFMLDQMQSVATSGFMAPPDMPGFKTVTGSLSWTTQLPIPFWDSTSKWHDLCASVLKLPQGLA